jgi:hypothetical protein
MKTVYDNGGECLSDEYVDLSGLHGDTKKAILQMIYLDGAVDAMNGAANKKTLSAMEKCLAMSDSDAVNSLNYGAGT